MSLARRGFLRGAVAALAAPARLAFAQTPVVPAPEVTLKLHHFVSAVSSGHARFLVPWARKVEADSGGRMRIEVFPSMQLGGSPAQLYDQVRDGRTDIAWAVPAATPARFPIIETFELPFVASPRARATSLALQEFAAIDLKDEFGDVHPICFWSHDRGVLHATRPVHALDDLRGLKLRVATRLAGEALRRLGAEPVTIPLPLVPRALAQQAIDGCILPWDVVPAARVQELVKFHTEVPGSPTLSTTTFVLAMNKAKYAGLPDDLKRVIDANSGAALAALAGEIWDAQAVRVEAQVRARGNAIAAIPQAEAERWRKATVPVLSAWDGAMKARGLGGSTYLEAVQELVAKHERPT